MILKHGIDQPTCLSASSPGTWWWEGTERDVILVMHCPNCRHVFRFGKTVHTINQEGKVSPSAVCPWPGCSFHVFVELADWDGEDRRTK